MIVDRSCPSCLTAWPTQIARAMQTTLPICGLCHDRSFVRRHVRSEAPAATDAASLVLSRGLVRVLVLLN